VTVGVLVLFGVAGALVAAGLTAFGLYTILNRETDPEPVVIDDTDSAGA